MTKTELLNELAKKDQKIYTFNDIREAIENVTGNTVKYKYGIGGYCVALYDSKPYKDSKSHYYAYFIRPSKNDSRYLKKVSRGKYIIAGESK